MHVPRPQPVRGSRHGRVGDRHRGRRDRRRELVELYNPAEIYRRRSPRPPARPPGWRAEPTATDDLLGDRRHAARGDVRRWAPSDARTRAPPTRGPPASRRCSTRTTRRARRSRCTTSRSTSRSAARQSEARLIEQFEEAAARLIGPARRPDHRRRRGRAARARRRPAGSAPRSCPRTATASGASSTGADELVEFYDPTDVFGDLADALAEAFPAIAPDARGRGRRRAPRPARTPWPPRMSRTAGRGRGRVAERSRLTAIATRRAVVARPATSHAHARRRSSSSAGRSSPARGSTRGTRRAVVSGARAGQYVHVRTIEPAGCRSGGRSRSPRPMPASGTLTTQAPGAPPSRGWAGCAAAGGHAST